MNAKEIKEQKRKIKEDRKRKKNSRKITRKYLCLEPASWQIHISLRRVMVQFVIVLSNLIAGLSSLLSVSIGRIAVLSWLLLFCLNWMTEFSKDHSIWKQCDSDVLEEAKHWHYGIRITTLTVSFCGMLFFAIAGFWWLATANQPVILSKETVTGSLVAMALVKAFGTGKEIHLGSSAYISTSSVYDISAGLPEGASN